MIGPAKIYFIIFGLLTIVGGVIGYVKAGVVELMQKQQQGWAYVRP